MEKITLRKNEEHRILGGHLWVFSNEIQTISGPAQSGDLVSVHRAGGPLLGVGFYNPHSLIAVRMLLQNKDDISVDLFKQRISDALALRTKLFPGSTVYRLVHGESDLLPGLIIDRYDSQFVIQTLSTGMDQRQDIISSVLQDLFSPTAIIERNDVPIRALEHLPERSGVLFGTPANTVIEEHGIRYALDLLSGQKTGLFLDQRENRFRIRRYAAGAEVLDCFSNSGGFALNAWKGTAAHVTGVEISERTVASCRENARLNDAEMEFVQADAFDQLKLYQNQGRSFDVVVLDPPSFTKSKKTVATALKGYRQINGLGASLLRKGGFLITSTCSHHIDREEFLASVADGARKAGKDLRLVETAEASPDHPVHPSMPETRYLLCAVFAVAN